MKEGWIHLLVNFVFWILLCGGLTVLLCLSIKTASCFFKYRIIKVIGSIFVLLLAIVAFFFSIHANILSQHDEKRVGLS
jgi:glucan phosphoethanolaminetransferase (alkaline phosphatase superfamily)